MSTYRKYGMVSTKEAREARHDFWKREHAANRQFNNRWTIFFLFCFVAFLLVVFRGPQVIPWIILAAVGPICVWYIVRWLYHRYLWVRWWSQ